jgi:hypothetical protein
MMFCIRPLLSKIDELADDDDDEDTEESAVA